MHKTEARLISATPSVSVDAVLPDVSVSVKSKTHETCIQAVILKTVSVALLSLSFCVAISQCPHPPVVRTVLCQTVSDWRGEYVSNFITADGEYFMLSDGSVLFVREES